MMPESPKSPLEAAAIKVVGKDEASRAAAVVEKVAAADPVYLNTANLEPWWQSGVGVFGTSGLLWSVGAILTQVGQHGLDFAAYDFGIMVTALGALASFAAVLYRRFWPGLKPMFHWWFK
jgi:hypothetical protein